MMADGIKTCFWTSISLISQYNSYYWTSMPIFSQTIPYYWTSMPIISQYNSYYWVQHLRKNIFWELVPGKMSMGIFQFSSKQTLFSKWLRRPNHYAHETRIEILSKTPVSVLRDLSPGVQNHRKTFKYSFLV